MKKFMDQAREYVEKQDEQIDQGMEKAGDMVNERTGGRYKEQVDRGVDMMQARTGEGDQVG
ncbi:antitoxin [Salinispora arenicola]|uniref:Antitoxin protein of toxin-antitoxin system n=2 Tax=Salinispora arenicola TaxID=168697 RepID=A0A542XIN3_SALAC|nr:antitoxin [Salinispora arenicola]MCN0150618.1 antitoxin [Salinispora arenicola]MCN0177256.1 antitoxin [Salinispora arenicola]NIL42142.1 antitoxin [Salinispora arenicola]NIL55923.1 antitoxin [Salinispora arenicola]NIL60610.1 antitoxin [Salinispora arenicola]